MYRTTIEIGQETNLDANHLIVELFQRDGVQAAFIEPGERHLFSHKVVADCPHFRDAQELVDDMRLRGYRVTYKYEETQ